jgi:hypothetical protein
MPIAVKITASLFIISVVGSLLIAGTMDTKTFNRFAVPVVCLTGVAWLLTIIWSI